MRSRFVALLCLGLFHQGQIATFAKENVKIKVGGAEVSKEMGIYEYLEYLLVPDNARKLLLGSDRPKEVADISSVFKILDEKKPTKMEDLLAALPEQLRTNYVLMYQSESLQDASFEAPRAILYNYDASLMMAFNGHSGQNRSNDLEAIAFDPKKKRWDFYNIRFDGKNTPTVQKNPAVCKQCHGDPLRPIFAPYPIWPGAYGANEDRIEKGSKEDKGFRKFLETAPKDPRYRHLVGLNQIDFNKDKDELIGGRGFPVGSDRKDTHYALPTQPSTVLTINLVEQNYARLAATLEPFWDTPLRYTLAGALNGCMNIDQFLPESVRSQTPGDIYEITQEAKTKKEALFKELIERHFELSGTHDEARAKDFVDISPEQTFINLIYLSRKLYGFDMRNYVLAGDRDSLDLSSPIFDANRLRSHMGLATLKGTTEFLKADEEMIRKKVGLREVPPLLCDKLKELSLEALKDYLLPKNLRRSATPKTSH